MPLDDKGSGLVEDVLRSYPYFQAFHALRFKGQIVRKEYSVGDVSGDAIYIPDRKRFYAWAISPLADDTATQEFSNSRTVDLIDSFLNNAYPKGDATHAYDESDDGERKTSPVRETTVIEEKGETNAAKVRKASDSSGDYSLDADDIDDACFTETLAKIYVKQERYEKALEIIKKLSLKYPKKNIYFANQIKALEEQISNKKNETN